MLRLFTLLLLTSTVALTGCKLKVIVPAGGQVITESNNFSCGSEQTCDVVITTPDFDETFLADPDPGFVFTGWKKRPKGLCGGTSGPCRLFTTIFAGNPVLMSLLDGTTEYYVEAQFAAGGGGDGPILTENASACYNAARLQPGTRLETTYESSITGVPGSQLTYSDEFIDGSATFEGQSVTRSTTEISSDDFSSSVQNYFQVDDAQLRVTYLGSDSTDSFGSIARQTYEPGLLTRLDLAPGESYSQIVTSSVTVQSSGIELPPSVSELEQTVTYIGVQEITVPAGTFKACRFEFDIVTRTEGLEFESYLTVWHAVGSGVLLRDRGDGAETVLVEGTLNGTAL
jgi:hypothetical protein